MDAGGTVRPAWLKQNSQGEVTGGDVRQGGVETIFGALMTVIRKLCFSLSMKKSHC